MEAPPHRRLRTAGLVASAIGILASFAASSFTGAPFPPAAIAEFVLRATPGDLATFAIDTLKHWAMRLLTLGVLLGTLFFGAEVFVRTSRAWSAAVIVALASAVACALAPMGDKDIIDVALVALVGGGAYGLALGAAEVAFSTERPDLERRRVMLVGLGALAAVSTAGAGLGWLLKRLAGPDTDVDLVAPEVSASVPARTAFPDVPGLTPEITSVSDHYVVDIDIFDPVVEASDWSLEVSGEVERSLELTFSQLQERFDIVEEYSVLCCVSNEVGGNLIGHSRWGGVRLVDVLDEAGVRPSAADVVFRAADGYSDSIPLAIARDPSVLLAVSQNGRPLRQEHGFPCRVRVPQIYGMKNVKWVTEIELVSSDYDGYWQRRGWSDEAVVKTQSRIDVAGDDGEARVGEETWIAGIAWAGARGVSRVEVSTDGGESWAEAQVKEPIVPSSWRLWAYRWTPEREGRGTVLCRATDGEGTVQTARVADPHPDGASGYHSTDVDVA